MAALRAGVVRTSADLFSAFAEAEIDVRQNLRGEDKVTDPVDEQYRSAELITASLLGDTATLTIRLLSMAGESRVVIYPLRVSAAT